MSYPDYELYEMTTIGQAQAKVKGKKYLVSVHYDSKRIGRPYFRFYDSPRYSIEAKVARISFIEPVYENHPDGGNEQFKLNNKQKKILIKYMNSPAKGLYVGFTNWQKSIILFNSEAVDAEFNWSIVTKEYKEENKAKFSKGKWKNALPIDLDMPDYMLLPE